MLQVETFHGTQTCMICGFTTYRPTVFNLSLDGFLCKFRVSRNPFNCILKASRRQRTINFQSLETTGTPTNALYSKCEILLAELAFSNPLEFPKLVESNIYSLDESSPRCIQRLNVSRLAATDILLCCAVLDALLRECTVLTCSADLRQKPILLLIRDTITDMMSVLHRAVKVYATRPLHLHPFLHIDSSLNTPSARRRGEDDTIFPLQK